VSAPLTERPQVDPPLIDAVVAHAVGTRLDDLPLGARAAARLFLLDAFGVGNSGAATPESARVRQVAASWGAGEEARIWASGAAAPAGTAAFINAHQMHTQEFDAIHEPAVVHPLTVVVPAVVAWMQRAARSGRTFSGADLMTATAVGVDVAAGLGRAATTGLQFFRPSVCGGMGAVAAIANVDRSTPDIAKAAFGIAYGAVSGTMQPHTEGAPVLATQCGLNARAAIHSFDLAAAGLTGPEFILEGRYGWFSLIEREGDPRAFVEGLGRRWEIAETSIKPFPSGRATHGGLDGVRSLQREHGFTVDQVAAVTVRVPSLVFDLVGRPPEPGMDIGAARLCLALLIPHMLRDGTVDLGTYEPGRLNDTAMLEVARRVTIERDDNPDPNAFTPQYVDVTLTDGRRLTTTLTEVLGSPGNPLSAQGVEDKFRANLTSVGRADTADAVIELTAGLDDLSDIRPLLELL
jgi:aconitate decarboxylase